MTLTKRRKSTDICWKQIVLYLWQYIRLFCQYQMYSSRGWARWKNCHPAKNGFKYANYWKSVWVLDILTYITLNLHGSTNLSFSYWESVTNWEWGTGNLAYQCICNNENTFETPSFTQLSSTTRFAFFSQQQQ